jgi:RND family efflux transporter MFP subunit
MNDMTPRRGEVEIETPAAETEPVVGRRRRGGVLLGLGVFAALVGGLAYGTWRHFEQERAVAAATQQRLSLTPTVHTAPVKVSPSTITITLPATTSAFTTANIFARASGYVDKRNVDIGDHVKQGELLAEITAPELDHQIAQAKATLGQSQAALQQNIANMQLANVTWQRDKPLVEKGWVTPQQGDVDSKTLQAQQGAVGVAQANVAAQQAQIAVLEQQKDYQKVVAPFNGVVTQRNIDIGSLVQADATTGTFMFTIMQTDVIRTQVYVPQDEAFGVAPGVEAVVHVPELPDRRLPAKVTRTADALDPTTRTLLTEVDVQNPDGTLPAGIYCTVELHIPRKTPGVIVPADAVVFDGDGLHVAVVDHGVAHYRPITLARDFGTTVEVNDGIRPGDQVILNPPVDLADGSKVDVQPEAQISPPIT